MLTKEGWSGDNGWENYPLDPTFKWQIETPYQWVHWFGNESQYRVEFQPDPFGTKMNTLTVWEWQWNQAGEANIVCLARVCVKHDFFPSVAWARKCVCNHMATRWQSLV